VNSPSSTSETPTPPLSRRAASLAPSATLEMVARVKALQARGIEILDLTAGEPDFAPPESAAEGARAAIAANKGRYTAAGGIPELRAEVAKRAEADFGLRFAPEQIVVTAGAKIAIGQALLCLVNPGDEVLIPAPFWTSYPEMVKLAGGEPLILPASRESGFKITPKQVLDAAGEAKILILNSPGNPTGITYSPAELEEIAKAVLRTDLIVFSDEIYEKMIWDGGEHFALSSIDGMKERTLIVQSFSKTFAMTGWRLGYIIGPNEILQKLADGPVGSAAATFIQRAGAAALRKLNCHDIWGPPTHIELWRRELYRRLKLMRDALNEIDGVECRFPESTFYLWPDFSGLGLSTEKVTKLLEEKRVMVDPGTKYGPSCDGHVRIGMVQPYYYIEEAAKRIKEALSSF